MITISLCMIVKDEEDVLGRCLASIKDLVDEIIIVDTGSSDKTKLVAKEYTDQVYSFHWIDNFSAARNYSFSKATKDYCMWMDADDVMDDNNRTEFMKLKQSLTPDTDIVMMRYNTAFDEDGRPSFWYYRERLIRNNQNYLWQGAVHEVITPNGKIVYSDAAISHKKLHIGDPDRNLNIYRKLLSEGKTLSARELYYYARELYYHGMYEEAVGRFHKFLSLDDAWIENKIEACIVMSKCYMKTGNRAAALQVLLKSMEYDIPRAEICCEVGSWFMEAGQHEVAIFWYETALECKLDLRKGGFILPDCYNYIPALQLCVCYDRLGRHEEAVKYNEKAGLFKPDSPAFLYNKTYFNQKEIFQ